MQSKYLVLALVLSSGFALVSADEMKNGEDPHFMTEGPDDWKEPHYQVYATQGSRLGHKKTLELLKKLLKIYEGREDFGSKTRIAKVSKLISVSEVTKEKCNREYLKELDKLIVYHFSYKLNVVPYIKHYRNKQKAECKGSPLKKGLLSWHS